MEFIKRTNSVSVSEVNRSFNDLLNDTDIDNEFDNKILAADILKMCFAPEASYIANGLADDFHNLAVTLAIKDHCDWACIVLEAGLKRFPMSIDLLSDFLTYGVMCGRFDDCQKYFNQLVSMPFEKWNWRAYDFSIDYLLACSNREIVEHEKIEDIIERFIIYDKSSERAFVAKSNYLMEMNKKDEAEIVLKEAVENLSVTPICTERLARIYFEKGDFSEANLLIEKCKIFSTQLKFAKEIGSLYILSALCKMAIFYLHPERDEKEKKKLSDEIYSDYRSAMKTSARSSRMFINLSTLIDVFSVNSGYPNDY